MYSKQQPKCTVHTPFRKPYFCTTLLCEEGVLCCNESVMDSILFQRKQRDLWQGQSAAIKSQERVWATSLSVKPPPLSSTTMLFLLLNHLAWSLSPSLAFSPISVFIVLTPFWPPSPSLFLSLTVAPSSFFFPFIAPSLLCSFPSPLLHSNIYGHGQKNEGDTRGNVKRSSVRLRVPANERTKETRKCAITARPLY